MRILKKKSIHINEWNNFTTFLFILSISINVLLSNAKKSLHLFRIKMKEKTIIHKKK